MSSALSCEYSRLLQLMGENMRKYRQRKGLTQNELAGAVGMAGVSVANLEKGVFGTTLSTVCKIATALDVPVISLFLEDGDFYASRAQLLNAALGKDNGEK